MKGGYLSWFILTGMISHAMKKHTIKKRKMRSHMI